MSDPVVPPKPRARQGNVSIWRYLKLFRADILSAQPDRLFDAKMAEFKTPFFRSYLVNDPALWRRVLQERPADFPKSERVSAGLRPLLGNSVFVTNGETWRQQRRIIDPAFDKGRVAACLPAMWQAADALCDKLQGHAASRTALDVEPIASYATADVIFRTLFSRPIRDETAQRVYDAFRDYQRAQPLLNLGALLPLATWLPRLHKRRTRRAAHHIRDLIGTLVDQRLTAIADGTAPDDLATRLLSATDPVTGRGFGRDEMIDQVAIFFLAGHETSASTLAWALYLCALAPNWQDRVAAEGQRLKGPSDLRTLSVTRDVFRETLRLYPPVPMMVRETTQPETFRKRAIARGAQIIISPWHLHRHRAKWQNPDVFDPERWQARDKSDAPFLPFSLGPRACPGAGFAMAEGPLLLARVLARFRVTPDDRPPPEPVAHLTLRARDGIWLHVTPRSGLR